MRATVDVNALSTPGYYRRARPRGFAVHLNVTEEHLRRVRELTVRTLTRFGIGDETVEAARLVVSELVGNAVRVCGDFVPVVVEVDVMPPGVAVNVHDPEPLRMPSRKGVALNDRDAESGRGLVLLDLLAPEWRVFWSPIGKMICCQVPRCDHGHG
ncbi:ATP-binding protein [Streptomyces syringium]|uniref:ATP-binding protein n=1 Tax=Streptomyces syringium TaxID=76729 RepID=UPI0034173FC5